MDPRKAPCWTLVPALALVACARSDVGAPRLDAAKVTVTGSRAAMSPPTLVASSTRTRASSTSGGSAAPPSPTLVAASVGSPVASAGIGVPGPRSTPPRILRFAWRPQGARAGEYAMSDPEDQHQIVLLSGVGRGGNYPVVIGFHGQPGRGESPRNYAFPRTVKTVVLELAEQGAVAPLILVLPTFRFQGQNWPAFDLPMFVAEMERVLTAEAISAAGYYLFGHSAGAGCGGDGLNRAHRIHPRAVGFFDTCVGPGFAAEVSALRRNRVPTLIVHGVETAGYRPRPPMEYVPNFDYGKVYAPLGLRPVSCPERLPDAPLRNQPYRCASDQEGVTRALVVDTGEGQAGHDAVVPVALRHFLREYVAVRNP